MMPARIALDERPMDAMERSFGRRELLAALACVLVLVWMNAYICRELFFNVTAPMASMHGFWAAIAKLAGDAWWHPTWWPYWDCGIPFEFTYAPLVPALMAAGSALAHISPELAFQWISGAVYCLAPVTLFLMLWLFTRAPGYSLVAALLYSLTSPTQLLAPDGRFSLTGIWDARRLMLVSVWDDTPHVTALALLPLIVVFLVLSIRKRRLLYYAAAALLIAVAALASTFGPTMVAMAALCLLFVLRREDLKRNVAVVLAIGAFAYALVAPFLSPSLLLAIRAAAGTRDEERWSAGSVTAIALLAVGWVILWRYLQVWTRDWRLRFFALFAYLTSAVPLFAAYLHRQFLPQPGRYKLEMELALAPLLVFAVRPWFERASPALKAALLLLVLGLTGEQIAGHRHYAKTVLQPGDATRTIEYQTAMWADQNLHGVRVLMPGAVAQWTNTFTAQQQFSGSSWSIAANIVQQRALGSVFNDDARPAIEWLQAYGVGAVAVSGPNSEEFWKPFAHPDKFEGVLPVLWRSGGVTFYKVPQVTTSFAHVMPRDSIARTPGDVKKYVAALEDASLAPAQFEWQGRNRARIRTTALPSQVVSVQVSYNPGWRAYAGGHPIPLRKDGLGLMWIDPKCSGPCEVELDYGASWELRLCRWLSYAALAALFVVPIALWMRRRRAAAQLQ